MERQMESILFPKLIAQHTHQLIMENQDLNQNMEKLYNVPNKNIKLLNTQVKCQQDNGI